MNLELWNFLCQYVPQRKMNLHLGWSVIPWILVTDLGDEMCWGQVWDVDDRFKMMVTNLLHRKCHQHVHSATNITETLTETLHQQLRISFTHKLWVTINIGNTYLQQDKTSSKKLTKISAIKTHVTSFLKVYWRTRPSFRFD